MSTRRMFEYAHIRCVPEADRTAGLVRREGVNPLRGGNLVRTEYLRCRYCHEDIRTWANAMLGPFVGPFARRDVEHFDPRR